MTQETCPTCKGKKLKDIVLAVTVCDMNIIEMTDLSVIQAIEFFEEIQEKLTDREKKISEMITKEIRQRLQIGRASCRERV